MATQNGSSDSENGAAAETGAVNEALTASGPTTGRLDDTLSGHLLDRSHTTAPYNLGPMIAEEMTAVGVRDVAIWLQDYDQRLLHPVPLPDQFRPAEAIDGSLAGRAFTLHTLVEIDDVGGGRRVWAPMLDGTDRVGVIAMTLDVLDDEIRGYVRRVAGNVAHLFFSKALYTDDYDRLRRHREFSLAAEMQWSLLPPLAITTPRVSVAGLLEPAYHIAGDSFDYALNADALHVGIFDAMGHGLASAIMASTAISAYRHARRSDVPLDQMYGRLDAVMSEQFGDDTFATSQIATLDVETGLMRWINAGHPPPLLVRRGKAVRFLTSEPTLPVGLTGGSPSVSQEQLEPGDRLLFFTDGVIEHRNDEGEMFGEDRLAARLLRHLSEELPTAEVLRRLNRELIEMVGPEGPADDSTLLLVRWLGPQA